MNKQKERFKSALMLLNKNYFLPNKAKIVGKAAKAPAMIEMMPPMTQPAPIAALSGTLS